MRHLDRRKGRAEKERRRNNGSQGMNLISRKNLMEEKGRRQKVLKLARVLGVPSALVWALGERGEGR